jgi:hypothetical protein
MGVMNIYNKYFGNIHKYTEKLTDETKINPTLKTRT